MGVNEPHAGEAGRRDTSSAVPGSDRLTFPDLPRMELDQLLGQLVDRAQEVMGTQGRLRGLLRASQMVAGDLALPTLLRRIVEAARELLGARYAALGVIGPDGQLAEFVHVGMDAGTVARVGHLPEGKGLLGAVVEDPRPIRLTHITDDPRSSGFPDEHPPMSSFLGVPIRVRGVVFGNLYLTECAHGEFTAEDEELALALAATAGQAIDNARLYQTARKQQEWLRASAAITRELLSSDSDSPLTLIANHTRDLADADLVSVVRPTEIEGQLRVEVAVGDRADELVGHVVAIDESLSGRVFTSGEPLVGSWIDQQSRLTVAAAANLNVDAVMVVPLTGAGQINGVLTAARKVGRPGFTADDLEMAAGFANQASVSIELADARAEQQRNEVYDERDRIAAELHSQVVQRLYALGLSLQSTAGMARAPVVAQRLRTTIVELDGVIAQIQDTVFRLDDVLRRQVKTLRDRVLEVLTELGGALGFATSTQFSGKLDGLESEDLADDLVAALREGLQFFAQHGRSSSVQVEVESGTERLSVVLACDGPGVLEQAASAELVTLTERAERHGGAAEVTATRLSWSVPLP